MRQQYLKNMIDKPNYTDFKNYKEDKYDVVIIGAGIGGLVCGCYLAKAGLKVLIVEQHYKPGGYCTSFQRGGYTFDVGVHYLGSCRERDGVIYNILQDLSLLNKIKLLRNDPCERIITPNEIILIRQDKEKTKQELINHFPKEEQSIKRFFDFILTEDLLSLVSKTKSLTFNEFLNAFFQDYKLKTILSIPIGNLGISPSKASALSSIFLYREYILDGGYYPQGGIQNFPDLLASKFTEYGGGLLLSNKVKRIIVKNERVTGIELNEGKIIQTGFVVSNADATTTFKELMSSECIEKKKVEQLEISPSAFIVYLGLNNNLEKLMDKHFSTWLFSTYDLERCFDTDRYYNLERYDHRNNGFNVDYLICHFPSLVDRQLAPKDKSVVRAMVWVKSTNRILQADYKEYLYKKIVLKLNEIIPDIQKSIEIKETASPSTLHKYTSNWNGSSLGWSSAVNQVDRNIFPSQTSIKGLYLSGHWVTNGIGQSGIPLVAFCGRNVANLLLRYFKVSAKNGINQTI
jgi:phytoene dehydrogenase-like protein